MDFRRKRVLMSLVTSGTASFLFYFLFGYLRGYDNLTLATALYFLFFATFSFFYLHKDE